METGALAVGATGLIDLLEPGLYVLGVFSVELTILVEFELALYVTPIFLSNVVLLVTFGALQCDNFDISLFRFSHTSVHSFNNKTDKPSIGLEPMTPSLPWRCSAD